MNPEDFKKKVKLFTTAGRERGMSEAHISAFIGARTQEFQKNQPGPGESSPTFDATTGQPEVASQEATLEARRFEKVGGELDKLSDEAFAILQQEDFDFSPFIDKDEDGGMTAEQQLALDAKAGNSFPDLILRYEDDLPLFKIRAIYNSFTPFGDANETGADVQRILGGESGSGASDDGGDDSVF